MIKEDPDSILYSLFWLGRSIIDWTGEDDRRCSGNIDAHYLLVLYSAAQSEELPVVNFSVDVRRESGVGIRL